MNADQSSERREWGAQLVRTTDYARRLIRLAQVGLGALAIPVSVMVGMVVAGTDQPNLVASPSASAAAQPVTAESISLVGLPARDGEDAGAAAEERTARGLAAGLGTVSICWLILGTGGRIWRRRLDERDLRAWADGWARVEPLWSGRPF